MPALLSPWSVYTPQAEKHSLHHETSTTREPRETLCLPLTRGFQPLGGNGEVRQACALEGRVEA